MSGIASNNSNRVLMFNSNYRQLLYQLFRATHQSGTKMTHNQVLLIICIVSGLSLPALSVPAASIMKPFNDMGYGTISGRIQSLTMARDYDTDAQISSNGANSTLGGILSYTSPLFSGFDAGLAYNYAGDIYSNNNTDLLGNDAIHILNEAWGRYSFGGIRITAGRKINNGEVFRADDIRQKARALELVQLESRGLENLQITGGHAFKASHVFQKKDLWEFNDFGDVFAAEDDTDGVTWLEGLYTGISNLELVVFDAMAWDVTNMIGTRIQYTFTPGTSILAYGRVEFDTGGAPSHNGSTFGVSLVQHISQFRLEGGYLGLYDDGLKFEQMTTGFNHALGNSLMIYTGQWKAGADTYYLKATTKVETTGTILYLLANYTDNSTLDENGYELNCIVKQPVVENLLAVFKYGYGKVDTSSGYNKTGTDVRFFLTYSF